MAVSRIAVISPHLDDAVFSVGEHMLSRPDDEFTIVCPCGEVPAREPHRSKYEILLAEHAEVCDRMGWRAINGPFDDDAAAAGVDEDGAPNGQGLDDQVGLVHWLAAVLQNTSDSAFRDKFDEWWVPAGIHHPDHIETREAVDDIGRATARIAYYEELPYRVRYPWGAYCRERGLMDSGKGWQLTGWGPLGEQLEAKRRLCHLYASQIGPDIERHLYADERLWQ